VVTVLVVAIEEVEGSCLVSDKVVECMTSVGTDNFSGGDYIAIPLANNDSERLRTLSETLPVGISWETDCNKKWSNETTVSSHTERVSGSVYSMCTWHHLCVCFSLST